MRLLRKLYEHTIVAPEVIISFSTHQFQQSVPNVTSPGYKHQNSFAARLKTVQDANARIGLCLLHSILVYSYFDKDRNRLAQHSQTLQSQLMPTVTPRWCVIDLCEIGIRQLY